MRTVTGQRRFKRISITIGIVFGLIAILLISGRLWVTSDHAQEMIQSRINRTIPGTLTWDELSLSIFKGDLEVRTLRLLSPAGEELLSLDRGYVNLTWSALLRGELAVEAVILEAPQLYLKREENGELNILKAFPQAMEPKSAPQPTPSQKIFPVNIVIHSLILTDGSFRYQPSDPGETTQGIDLDGIDFTLSEVNLYEESGGAELRLGKGDMAGFLLDRALLKCSLRERRLVLHSLSLTAPMGRIKATGVLDLRDAFKEGLMTRNRDLEALAYTIELIQTGTALNQLPGMATGITGRVESHLSLKGTGISPPTLSAEGRLRLSVEKLAFERGIDPLDLTLTLRAALHENRITLRRMELTTGAARLEASGSYAMETDAVEATAKLKIPDLEALKISPPTADLKGSLSAQITVSGSAKRPVVDARLLCESLGIEGISLGTLSLAANLESSGMLNLTTATLTNNDSTLQAQGSVKILENGLSTTLPADLTVEFHQITADNFFKDTGVSGAVDGTLTLSGPLLSPEASLTLAGDAIAIKGQPIGNINGRLRLTRGALLLDGIDIHKGKSHLNLSGTARVLDAETGTPLNNPTFDLTLGGEGLFLEDLFPSIRGKLTLAGRFTGSASHPLGTLELQGGNLDLGVQKIHGITLTSRLDKDRVTVDTLKVALAPGEEIVADGWILPMENRFALSVRSKGLSLKQIDFIEERDAVNGAMDLSLTARGDLENPRIEGEMGLTRLRLYDEPFRDSRFTLTLQDHLAHISGNLIGELQGRFDLATHAFSVEAMIDHTRLTPFFKMGGRDDLTGTLSGRLEVQGNTASPEKIRAMAEISQFSVSQDEREMVRAVAFTASYLDERILIPKIRLTLFDEGYLDIGGEKRRNGSINFEAEGTVPLEVVNLFIQEPGDITGEMRLSAEISGTLHRPDFEVEITMDDMGFTVPVLEQRIHTVHGRIQITPEAMILDHFTGGLDSGRFDGSARIALKDLSPVSISARFNAHTLPLSLPGTMETLLNGRFTLEGTPEQSLIAGEIVILSGRYTKDVNLGLIENIVRKKRRDTPAPRDDRSSRLNNTILQIAIRHRAPFIIDNNLTLMALKPTLKIYGPLNTPHISGRAEVESGMINYLGKEFEIKRGVVDFINPYKIEPTLDLSSEVRVRKWTIFLKISGVMDNLKFEMSSNPAEADEEILSLLTFGKTTGELISRESGTSQSTKQILADFMTKGLQERLKEATGLDTIELKYTERPDQDHADDINITVGKELSKRITIKYGVGTKNGEPVQSAITEYKFFENVLMNAFQDTAGDFGGELMFRLEFR